MQISLTSHKKLCIYIRYTFSRQITTFIKVCVAFDFGLQTLQLIDFIKFFQLKGLRPKHKDHTNLYKRFDLKKKFI